MSTRKGHERLFFFFLNGQLYNKIIQAVSKMCRL